MHPLYPPPYPPEPPRQVHLAAGEHIAEALAPKGFRFAKSRSTLTRRDGPFTYRIHFQADRHNTAGAHVQFWIHGGVENADAERWLAESEWPFPPRAQLGGGQIGNLQLPHAWWSWEIADPATRQSRTDDALSRVETVILPFFARLSDPASLADDLVHSVVAGVEHEDAVRLCYWQLGKSAAEQCIAFWVQRYGAVDTFRAERDRVRDGGTVPLGYGNLVRSLGAIAGALGIAQDI